MHIYLKYLLLLVLTTITYNQCNIAGGKQGAKNIKFGDYWYAGQAELTSYTLQQARYGAMHDGEAVMIFVTEDFSKSKQVKLDNPSEDPDDVVKVMKLNFTKKFITGIYPYSMMSSVFTPVDQAEFPGSMKVTTSSQEWCGHAFTQFNRLEDNGYRVEWRSYFESEGDGEQLLDKALLEDEIWNMIRLAPGQLPLGVVELIPGTMYQRLSHAAFQLATAEARMEEVDEGLKKYVLKYNDPERTLAITFRSDFPHEIEGWEETYRDGFGENARELTTQATLKERIKLDYWNHNQPEDKSHRRQLGLD